MAGRARRTSNIHSYDGFKPGELVIIDVEWAVPLYRSVDPKLGLVDKMVETIPLRSIAIVLGSMSREGVTHEYVCLLVTGHDLPPIVGWVAWVYCRRVK